jgi:hypothetical protein
MWEGNRVRLTYMSDGAFFSQGLELGWNLIILLFWLLEWTEVLLATVCYECMRGAGVSGDDVLEVPPCL